jgi:hypothetical protein
MNESGFKCPIIYRGEAKKKKNYHYWNPALPPTHRRPPCPPMTGEREASRKIWGGGQGKDDTASVATGANSQTRVFAHALISEALFTSRVFEGMEGDYFESRNFSNRLFTSSGFEGIIPGYPHKFLPL